MARTSSSSSKRRTWDLHRAGTASNARKARSSVPLPAHAAIEAEIEAENKSLGTLVNGIRERVASLGSVRNVKGAAGERSTSEKQLQVRLLKRTVEEKARRSGRQAKKTKVRMPLARNDLDVFPNEILSQILGHLHQPFHYHNYSSALLGTTTVSPHLRPWNPVGLQSVSRRFRSLAQPLFYRQIALDFTSPAGLDTLVSLAEKELFRLRRHPTTVTSHTRLVVVSGTPPDGVEASFRVFEPINRILEAVGKEVIHSGDHFGLDAGAARKRTWVCEGPLNKWHTQINLSGLVYDSLEILKASGPVSRRHRDESVTIRIATKQDLKLSLKRIVEGFDKLIYLPKFGIDFPFALDATLLDGVFPMFKRMLQHQTLLVGRDAILKHLGATKTIIFGTHSAADAIALQARIATLGTLAVVVEVVVLDI